MKGLETAVSSRQLVWSSPGWTAGAVAAARAQLRRALRRAGLAPDPIDNTVLAASELIGNALEHASGPYTVSLCWTTTAYMCEVSDGDPRIPDIPAFSSQAPIPADPDHRGGGLDALCDLLTERGRGLHIVDHLTLGAWGFRLPVSGTRIAWMAMPWRPPAGGDPAADLISNRELRESGMSE